MKTFGHKRRRAVKSKEKRCYYTGLPIEKGDYYESWCAVNGEDFYQIRGLSVIVDICERVFEKYMTAETYSPNMDSFYYLSCWLEYDLSLSPEELKECLEAARGYWDEH